MPETALTWPRSARTSGSRTPIEPPTCPKKGLPPFSLMLWVRRVRSTSRQLCRTLGTQCRVTVIEQLIPHETLTSPRSVVNLSGLAVETKRTVIGRVIKHPRSTPTTQNSRLVARLHC